MFSCAKSFTLPEEQTWPLPVYSPPRWIRCVSPGEVSALAGGTCPFSDFRQELVALYFQLSVVSRKLVNLFGSATSCGWKWLFPALYILGWKVNLVLIKYHCRNDQSLITSYKLTTQGFMGPKKGRNPQVDEDVLSFIPKMLAKSSLSHSEHCSWRWAAVPNSWDRWNHLQAMRGWLSQLVWCTKLSSRHHVMAKLAALFSFLVTHKIIVCLSTNHTFCPVSSGWGFVQIKYLVTFRLGVEMDVPRTMG